MSFFLGFSESVRKSNRIGQLPSTEWLYGRIEGQAFINTFTKLMVKEINTLGMKATAPCVHPQYKEINRRSNWSERQVGFICGLGTFGLSKSLITDIGSAGRLTSIITNVSQHPSQRKYSDIYENYLWHMNKECGICMVKCPAHAILEDGEKDKTLCKAYLDEMKAKYHSRYGCGKCQAGMRCESKNPISSLL